MIGRLNFNRDRSTFPLILLLLNFLLMIILRVRFSSSDSEIRYSKN